MEGLKIKNLNIPEYIDWNSFTIKDMNSTNVIIFAHDLKRDINSDLEKLKILKQMPNLQFITVNSDDFNVGIYMGELLRDLPLIKDFHLLDDFQNRDRSYIQANALPKGMRFRSIPNSYIQWGANKKNLNYGFQKINNVPVVQFDTADTTPYYPSKEALEEIDRIITDFSKIPNLTFIDKVVLVANYLQQNVQFVSGKVSHTVDGNYECEGYSYEKYGGIDSVNNVIFDKIGKCNCISRAMMLMLNNPKMNVNCRIANSPGHSYCSVYDDKTGELYCVDPTWCISRNPNRFKDTLKASSFSDEFILIGQDKLSTMDFHNTSNVLPKIFSQKSIDRKLILQSIEKLKGFGISFDYPMDIPLPSIRTDRLVGEDITP